MPNTRSLFAELPLELAKKEIFLTAQDLKHLVLTAKPLHRLFQQPLQAAKLLHFTVLADYAAVEKIIKTNPALMFETALLKNGNSTEKISPLKFAFKVYDTPMWSLFLEAIGDNPIYQASFLQQAAEQQEHIDLQPLFTAYENFRALFSRYLNDQSNVATIYQAWIHLGKMQHTLIPWHMWRRFFQVDLTFNTATKFVSQQEARPSGKLTIYKYVDEYQWATNAFTPCLPNHDFVVVRGRAVAEAWPCFFINKYYMTGGAMRLDENALSWQNLFEARKDELATMLTELPAQFYLTTEAKQKIKCK